MDISVTASSSRPRIVDHPGGNPGANLKSISHMCHPILVAFVWELTKETTDLPLGCLWKENVTDTKPSGSKVSSRKLGGVPRSCRSECVFFALHVSTSVTVRKSVRSKPQDFCFFVKGPQDFCVHKEGRVDRSSQRSYPLQRSTVDQ